MVHCLYGAWRCDARHCRTALLQSRDNKGPRKPLIGKSLLQPENSRPARLEPRYDLASLSLRGFDGRDQGETVSTKSDRGVKTSPLFKSGTVRWSGISSPAVIEETLMKTREFQQTLGR